MITLTLATGNKHKLQEIRQTLEAAGLQVNLRLPEGGMPDVEETAESFAGNAALKRDAISGRVPAGAWALADDSGLQVDALNGSPGIRSARYAGEHASDADNNRKLLDALAALPGASRAAQFVCHLAVRSPEGTCFALEGICRGVIIETPQGEGGFGYDPLFIPEGEKQSFAALPASLKNRISHRARALEKLVDLLREQG